jgi:hypothetical protein
MKLTEKISNKFRKSLWYNRLETGFNKREFIIYCNYYPYTEDGVVYDFAKKNKIKIIIRPIGT